MKQKLEQIADKILSVESDFGKLRLACNELFELFSTLTGISGESDNERDSAETLLANGKAISPLDAARCILDFARTTAFLRGINAAIAELKLRFPDEKLEIVYAGCGPFAPLIVPLLPRFSASEIRLTLIDFHAHSIASAKEIFRQLQLEDFDIEFIQTDISTYKHARPIHLIICETMQKALKTEPQVAATLNLAPQLINQGIFIPQKISIETCLANSANEFGLSGKLRQRIPLGKIFELNAEHIQQNGAGNSFFAPVSVKIPTSAPLAELNFLLLTKIQVFDSFILDDYDSGITYPTVLHDLNQLQADNEIEFSYLADKNPRFTYKLTTPN